MIPVLTSLFQYQVTMVLNIHNTRHQLHNPTKLAYSKYSGLLRGDLN